MTDQLLSTAACRWLDEAAELREQLDDPVVCTHVQSLRTLALFSGRLEEALSSLRVAVASHLRSSEEIDAVYALIQMATAQSPLGIRTAPAPTHHS